jgi:hypothetical protein
MFTLRIKHRYSVRSSDTQTIIQKICFMKISGDATDQHHYIHHILITYLALDFQFSQNTAIYNVCDNSNLALFISLGSSGLHVKLTHDPKAISLLALFKTLHTVVFSDLVRMFSYELT